MKVCLRVANSINSQIVLGEPGAESLLGKGDLLCDLAVECALRRESGVIGRDEDRGGVLRAIEFDRIKGGKPFNTGTPWFSQLLGEIGQAAP